VHLRSGSSPGPSACTPVSEAAGCERRYQAFKGPLAVTNLYLKSNRRINALIAVICLALLIFCLIEPRDLR
jgi:transposase